MARPGAVGRHRLRPWHWTHAASSRASHRGGVTRRRSAAARCWCTASVFEHDRPAARRGPSSHSRTSRFAGARGPKASTSGSNRGARRCTTKVVARWAPVRGGSTTPPAITCGSAAESWREPPASSGTAVRDRRLQSHACHDGEWREHGPHADPCCSCEGSPTTCAGATAKADRHQRMPPGRVTINQIRAMHGDRFEWAQQVEPAAAGRRGDRTAARSADRSPAAISAATATAPPTHLSGNIGSVTGARRPRTTTTTPRAAPTASARCRSSPDTLARRAAGWMPDLVEGAECGRGQPGPLKPQSCTYSSQAISAVLRIVNRPRSR